MTKTCTLLLAAAVFFAACNDSATVASSTSEDSTQTSFDMSSARQSIDETNGRFENAMRSGDSAGIAANYSRDAIIMPSNSEAIQGEAITGFWGGAIGMGVKDVKLTTTDLQGNQDWLIESGNYELFADGNKSIDKGKYVVAWKNENGQWKMYRDIWNTNLPPMK